MKKLAVVILILGAGIVGCATVPANDWRNLPPTQFPARVAAILFGANGIDDSTRATWGRWTVALDTRTTAYNQSNPVQGIKWFTIKPLICSNEVAGKYDCTFVLRSIEGGAWECVFYDLGSGPAVTVTCPTGLRFR